MDIQNLKPVKTAVRICDGYTICYEDFDAKEMAASSLFYPGDTIFATVDDAVLAATRSVNIPLVWEMDDPVEPSFLAGRAIHDHYYEWAQLVGREVLEVLSEEEAKALRGEIDLAYERMREGKSQFGTLITIRVHFEQSEQELANRFRISSNFDLIVSRNEHFLIVPNSEQMQLNSNFFREWADKGASKIECVRSLSEAVIEADRFEHEFVSWLRTEKDLATSFAANINRNVIRESISETLHWQPSVKNEEATSGLPDGERRRWKKWLR